MQNIFKAIVYLLSLFKFNQQKSHVTGSFVSFTSMKVNLIRAHFHTFNLIRDTLGLDIHYLQPKSISVIWLCIFTHIIIVIIINFTHNSTNDSLSFNFTQFSCPPSMSRAQKKVVSISSLNKFNKSIPKYFFSVVM